MTNNSVQVCISSSPEDKSQGYGMLLHRIFGERAVVSFPVRALIRAGITRSSCHEQLERIVIG